MEVSKAKEFIILEDYYDNPSFIVSKDLDKILEITNNSLVGVFGIIDTEDGEVLMEMDWSYAGEPILMRRFLHKKFFINEYTTTEIKYL